MPNRREFCQALSLISVTSLMNACAGNPTGSDVNAQQLPVISASIVGGIITLNVDSASPLNAVGAAALVQTPSGDLLVARTAQDTFTALTATCTHQVCTISGYGGSTFVCPCHGSEFSTSGAVVRGPAAAPLRSFTTRFAAPALTITIA